MFNNHYHILERQYFGEESFTVSNCYLASEVTIIDS